MSSIDNRIVNMQFNNKGFESGVATTLNSLKKLNESLKMKNASKGLTDITDSLGKVNTNGMSGLSRGIEAVTSRFSTLGVIATTALMNITNKAVNAGTALAKSLTIDPVLTGFSEYETKMGAIQTILTNTAHEGKTLTDVTAVLDELNTYADQTIYNFAEMTKNIGTFTAAGVGLETSAAAIKGIANLAAASGSNSQQASTAMYQLSQALAAGKVSLADWNSVVNAGMGGKLFQDALIRTSEVLGTGAEDMIKKYGSFRESLTKGEWLTGEVLTETLKQLSGAYTEAELIEQGYSKAQAKSIVDLAKNATAAATEVKTVTQLLDTMKESVQSGWAQSWEHIIGDKDQATKTLTAISDKFNEIIEPSTKARNEMLKFWNEAGGRDQVIAGLSNVFSSLGKILGSVKDAFREVFPAMTGQKLVELSKGFKDFTEKIKISDETVKKIKDTFQGLFSIFGVLGDGFKTVISIFSSGTEIFGAIGNAALTVTSSIGKFFTNMYESLHASRIFENAANTIKSGLNSMQRFFHSVGEGINSFVGTLSKLDFKPILDFMGELSKNLTGGIVDIFEGLGKAIGSINLNTLIVGLATLAQADLFKTIKDTVTGFGDSLKTLVKGFSGIGDDVSGLLNGVRESLEAYQNKINAGTLTKIATAIALMAGSILLLSTIKPASLENALVATATLLAELVLGIAALIKITSGKGLFTLTSAATAIALLSAALLLLAAAVRSLSGLSWDEMAVGLTGVAGSMLILVAASKLMKTETPGFMSTAAALVVLAAALIVMAQAVKMFAGMNFDSMLQGLLGVGLALTELGLFMKLIKANTMGFETSAGLLVLAAALLVFQNAVDKFGNMDIPELVKGLASVGVLLLELAAFVRLTKGSEGMLGTAAAMVVMAGAINLMVPPIQALGNLSWEEIAKGLTSIAGALLIMGVASASIVGADLMSAAVGVGLMAVSMGLLVGPLTSLGGLSLSEICNGLLAMGGALAVFAVGSLAMVEALPGAAATLVMAGAIAVLAPQLIALGNLSLGEINIALLALAGTFAVFGLAGLALTPLAPVLLALAGGIALLGAGCAAAGAGVALFATGMAALAGVGAAGGFALAEILRQLIKLIPEFGAACGKALVEFAKAIGEGIPALAKAFGDMLTGICQAVADAVPAIVEAGLALLEGLCTVLLEGAPRLIDIAIQMVLALAEGLASNASAFVDKGVEIVVNLLNALSAKVGELIQAGIDLGIAIIEGLADGITNNQQRVEDAMEKLAKALLDAFKSMLGIHSPSTKMKEAGVDTIEGLLQGIESKVNEVITKIKTLATDMLNAIKSKFSEFLSTGKEIISNMISGISSKASEVKTKIQNAVSDALSAAKSKAGEFLSAGTEIISKLVSGVSSKASEIGTKLKNAVSSAKDAVSGMASSFSAIGKNIISSLASGISSMASSVASKARSVVQGAVDAAKSALKINSPSKVFMSMGNSVVEGFVKGIDDDASFAEKSSENMVKKAVQSCSDSIANVSKALNGNMQTDLTIRPVMDLSNVEAGTRTIKDMMAENSNFSINADATSAISRSVGNIQNGNNNAEIIAALRDLKSSMNGGNNTTYQINGITYDDGSNVTSAVETLIRAARIERRI